MTHRHTYRHTDTNTDTQVAGDRRAHTSANIVETRGSRGTHTPTQACAHTPTHACAHTHTHTCVDTAATTNAREG